MKPNTIRLTKSVRQRSQEILLESDIAFEKCIQALRKDGCLTDEIPLSGNCLFAFCINDDWVAVAQRQEARTLWGSRTLDIDVLDLIRATEFEEPANTAYLDSRAIGIQWLKILLKMVLTSVSPFFHRPRLPILMVMAVVAGVLTASDGYRSKAELKMETDGSRVTHEVSIDRRRSR
ncbi:MAG: hypothetical protein SWY16_23775 [Cyanobacteriota bacterium]|nr:hypothetical protein [Cyanobacteriota bacterium]